APRSGARDPNAAGGPLRAGPFSDRSGEIALLSTARRAAARHGPGGFAADRADEGSNRTPAGAGGGGGPAGLLARLGGGGGGAGGFRGGPAEAAVSGPGAARASGLPGNAGGRSPVPAGG